MPLLFKWMVFNWNALLLLTEAGRLTDSSHFAFNMNRGLSFLLQPFCFQCATLLSTWTEGFHSCFSLFAFNAQWLLNIYPKPWTLEAMLWGERGAEVKWSEVQVLQVQVSSVKGSSQSAFNHLLPMSGHNPLLGLSPTQATWRLGTWLQSTVLQPCTSSVRICTSIWNITFSFTSTGLFWLLACHCGSRPQGRILIKRFYFQLEANAFNHVSTLCFQCLVSFLLFRLIGTILLRRAWLIQATLPCLASTFLLLMSSDFFISILLSYWGGPDRFNPICFQLELRALNLASTWTQSFQSCFNCFAFNV
jgi:hypothetical protein